MPASRDEQASDTDSPEVVCLGAATVDRTYRVSNLPCPDGGAFAGEVTESPGGVGANVATGLARLGRDAGLVARLGEDDVGDTVADALAAGPVDDARVRRRPGTSTHCIVLRDPAGERMIVTAGDSTKRLRLTDADRDYLRRADAVFATAYVPDAVTRALLDLVDAAADPPAVAFDLSGPVEELVDRGTDPDTLARVVAAADCVVANEVAAASYLGRPVDPDGANAAVEALQARGATRGAITFGAAGATLFDPDSTTAVPAFDVDVADTTGAGDAFNAGLVDRWLLGDDSPAEAGRFAAAVAALNCRAEGARGGMPTAAEVESFLAARD